MSADCFVMNGGSVRGFQIVALKLYWTLSNRAHSLNEIVDAWNRKDQPDLTSHD